MVSRDYEAQRASDDGPEEFGSGLFDTAARRDAELPDIDWALLPEGGVRARFEVPSGSLAGMTMGVPGNARVVLVPGVTGSKEDFSLMMPELAAAGFFVLSFDLAGQYESAAAGPENLVPPRAHYDYELFINDLIAVLDTGAGASHVVGYSFGAVIAQLAFSLRPELFKSLTLLSCPPEPGQSFRGVSRMGPFTRYANSRIGAALMIWGMRLNLTKAPAGRVSFVNYRFSFTRRQSVRDIVELMKSAPDLRQILADARLPKLVAVGEHDLWPLRLHSSFARAIGAQISVYRAGHSPCESSPHQLCRDLLGMYTGGESQRTGHRRR